MGFVILIASCQLKLKDSRRERNEQIDLGAALAELHIHEVGVVSAFFKYSLDLRDRHSRLLCQSSYFLPL